MNTIDQELLDKIETMTLSEDNLAWRSAMRAAGWKVYADRERWTVKSWLETEGEDIQIRRAKLLACVLDNLEIKIHPFDEIVGRPTPGVIGCATNFDVSGDYIPDIWTTKGSIDTTLDANAAIDEESLEILRTSARLFKNQSFVGQTRKAWDQVFGTWLKDVYEAKLKDPGVDSALTPQSSSTLSWNKILRVGLRGYINEAQRHIDEYIAGNGTDVDKIYFWQSAIIVLEATIRHAHRYADLAEQMAKAEADPRQKAKLTKIAEVCRYVPEFPARNLHEALQEMQFCNLAKMLECPQQNNCHWGRADQYLYRFFINDYNNGVPLEDMVSKIADLIGRWGTQTMCSNASQKESHQIDFGINNMMLGGYNRDGEDSCNELTYLMLHVVSLLKLSSPTVGLRWNKKTPMWIMRKAIHTNMATKGGIPLFENDEVVIDNYLRHGIPYNEAVEWGGLGCVYPCLPTRAEHYGIYGVAAFNLAGLLHLTLHNGIDINGRQSGLQTGDVRTFTSFEQLYEAFFKQHKHLCHGVLRSGKIARSVVGKYYRTPLLSVLGIEGSMEIGQDVNVPHPDYSLYGVSDRAIIDVADSMMAVKKLVFDDKVLTMTELMDAIDSDFAGERGAEIQRLCIAQPKYGNDIKEVDLLVHRISEDSARIVHEFDNSPFPSYMVAREGLAWHYFGGLGVGALPNGHKAYEALYDGALSPMRGGDKNGPTAVLRSACTANYDGHCFAAVLNQKFTSAILDSDASVDKLIAYTNAYMGAGGSHIQYNIMDTETLKEAKAEPEKNTDLIVRIGGFSAYFVQLSSAMQDDVIYRSQFDL